MPDQQFPPDTNRVSFLSSFAINGCGGIDTLARAGWVLAVVSECQNPVRAPQAVELKAAQVNRC